jgi:hypothetical protein
VVGSANDKCDAIVQEREWLSFLGWGFELRCPMNADVLTIPVVDGIAVITLGRSPFTCSQEYES